MQRLKDIDADQKIAIPYVRVSSKAQVNEGNGLESQEARCREYARFKGYEIGETFRDEGVSGGLINRPGIQKMLRFLKQNRKANRFVVIIDDISRLARDIRAHLDLRDAIADAGAELESPGIEFGTDANSILYEQTLAVFAEHFRRRNAEQVRSRQRARVMKGYYVFAPVIGYDYVELEDGGKMLAPDEPNASIVRDALEGYASGRFQTPTEVKRFLETFPSTPRNKHGEVRLQLVFKMLRRSLYAGYITIEKWNLHLHPAKHEPLISFDTYRKIQERLDGNAKAPARKDLSQDFPLRGFVTCGDCDHPMSAGWSKGRNTRYPYYFCQNKACDAHRKSIHKDKIEGDFEVLLRELQPTPRLFHVARAMFENCWNLFSDRAKRRVADAKVEAAKLDRKIEGFMDRIVAADSPAVITAYENQIKKLEMRKTGLIEKAASDGKPLASFDNLFRTACAFLANPWRLWESQLLEHKRMVLRLAFPGRIAYAKNEGFRTPAIAEPFRLLGQLSAPGSGVVEPRGIEPLTSTLRT